MRGSPERIEVDLVDVTLSYDIDEPDIPRVTPFTGKHGGVSPEGLEAASKLSRLLALRTFEHAIPFGLDDLFLDRMISHQLKVLKVHKLGDTADALVGYYKDLRNQIGL